ncbi:MAG: right-handed parallel beta-helix repeat-containing protein, partial [Thermoplasmata archaeon]
MKRRVALAVMAFLVVSSFAGVNVRAVTVNDIVVIVSDYVNDSKVVAGALLNFTGSPPMVFENVTFQWFNPNGSLVYETASQPDGSGLARSNHTVDQTGEWWVNASYSQPPDIFFHNDSFQVLDEHWNSSSRVVERDLMVGEGATLTIDPGAPIAFDNGTRLSISGTLIAQGAWDRTIVFTSNSSSPGKGDWDGVYFYAGSESSVFDFAKVEYSENGAYVQSAATAIQNCTFENNTHGIRLSVSTSLIYNNTMINNGYGFRSYLSHPVLVLNIAVSNVYGFFSEGSALFVSQMNTAQGNEQVGFHLDFTTVQSTGDTSVGSLVGLRLGSSAGRIEAGNISGLDDGVYGYDSSATFYNSTVGGSLRDFFLEAGSSLVIVNSTFGGKVSAGNGCPACYLFVRNYLTIRTIVHETSEPVENATVKLTDNGMEVLFNLTGSQGYIWNITLAHETYDDGVRRDNDT